MFHRHFGGGVVFEQNSKEIVVEKYRKSTCYTLFAKHCTCLFIIHFMTTFSCMFFKISLNVIYFCILSLFIVQPCFDLSMCDGVVVRRPAKLQPQPLWSLNAISTYIKALTSNGCLDDKAYNKFPVQKAWKWFSNKKTLLLLF